MGRGRSAGTGEEGEALLSGVGERRRRRMSEAEEDEASDVTG